MALTAELSQKGITPKRIHTVANVKLDKVREAFAITRVELQTEADIPGIVEELARITGGSLRFAGNQIIFTLPGGPNAAPQAEQSAPAAALPQAIPQRGDRDDDDLSGLASGEASLSSNISSRRPESLLDAPQ